MNVNKKKRTLIKNLFRVPKTLYLTSLGREADLHQGYILRLPFRFPSGVDLMKKKTGIKLIFITLCCNMK